MKLYLHDAYYSFDYYMAINAIFCRLVDDYGEVPQIARHVGMSVSVIYRAFRYESVSLPTFLALASVAQVNLMDYIIKLD